MWNMVNAASVAPPSSVTAIMASSPNCSRPNSSPSLHIATPQRLFVQRLDAVGDLQHRRPARNQLLIKERVAILAALFAGPCQSAVQHLPIRFNLRPQILERRRFLRLQRGGIVVRARFPNRAATRPG